MEAEFFSVGFSHISFVLSLFRQVFINQPCHPWLSWITQCLIPVQCFGCFSVMTLRVVKQSSDPSRMPCVSAFAPACVSGLFWMLWFWRKTMENQWKMSRIIQQNMLYFGTHRFVLHINTGGRVHFTSFYPKRRWISVQLIKQQVGSTE